MAPPPENGRHGGWPPEMKSTINVFFEREESVRQEKRE
ncbi:hypothetical protein A2U01_0079529, partial [Trifolium medium]|nr:hypothetical protein [Trifolium medium]